MLHRTSLSSYLIVASLCCATCSAALAGPSKTYTPMPVNFLKPALPDKSRDAFLANLKKLAADHKEKALLKFVAPDFQWYRDFGGGFDQKAKATQNFRTAVNLTPYEGKQDWTILESLLNATVLGELSWNEPGMRKGMVCGPAEGSYDEGAFARLQEDTGSDIFEWVFVIEPAKVLEKPAKDAKVIMTLAKQAVRTSTLNGAPEGYVPVITPDGRDGYIANGTIHSFLDARLCYAKGKDGKWQIVAYVGGGD